MEIRKLESGSFKTLEQEKLFFDEYAIRTSHINAENHAYISKITERHLIVEGIKSYVKYKKSLIYKGKLFE